MAFATAAAIMAGTTAAVGYLDAKFHLSKDIQILLRVRKTRQEYAKAVKAGRISCYYFFEDAVRDFPDKLAIWSREGEYTWRESNVRVNQYAAFFLELGVRPGQLVAFYLQNSPDFLFAWVGLLATGCAPAMINYNLSGDALLHCLKISGAPILLTDEEEGCKARIREAKQRIESELGMKVIELSVDLKTELSAKHAPRISDDYRKGVKGSSPITLFYTSGTSGLPKACAFTMDRIFPSAATQSLTYGRHVDIRDDRFYNCMPLYHGTGGITAMINLFNGISTAIGKKYSNQTFWKDVRDSKSTWIIYVGETARYLLAAPPHHLDKKHKVRCMFGNGMRPDVWLRIRDRFGIENVVEFFNSSEGIFNTLNHCQGNYLINAVGHHGAIQRYILKTKFVPVEFEQETNSIFRDPKTGFAKRNSYEDGGEIIVKLENEAGFQGYWNDPGSTMKKLERDVFEKGDIYYRTGDALRRTRDGRWFFVDRLGDTFRWKSENVSTVEVAEVVGTFPGILEAIVYGVSVPGSDGKAGCAAVFISHEHQQNFDWSALTRFLKGKLPSYAVPVFIRVLEGDADAVRSHNNKQIKGPLKEEGVDPKLKGQKVIGGNHDRLFWLPLKGDSYIKFHAGDWVDLKTERSRL